MGLSESRRLVGDEMDAWEAMDIRSVHDGASLPQPLLGRGRHVSVVSDLNELEKLAPQWDELAIEAGRSRSLSAFVTAWYRHYLPFRGLIRVIVVTDDEHVIGVAPFFAARTPLGFYEYRMSSSPWWGVEPLYAAGQQEVACDAFGRALAEAEPTPDVVYMDSLRAGSPSAGLIREAWPHRTPVLSVARSTPWPRIQLGPQGFEGWLQSRSKNFRKQFRSDHKKLQAEGFEHRLLVDAPDIVGRLGEFRRLYEARRTRRQGAGPSLDATFAAMVTEVAHKVSGTGQLCMATIERPGEVIAADLMMCAGNGSSLWYGGFDESWGHLSPSKWNLAWTIEHAARCGVTDYDFGAGLQPYKQSFTQDAPIRESFVLARRGLRPFHTPAQLVPFGMRRAAGRFAEPVMRRVTGRKPTPEQSEPMSDDDQERGSLA